MFVGGPEDIPIEGDEFEKSKPKVLSISGYSFISLIAHFFVQDVGGVAVNSCTALAHFPCSGRGSASHGHSWQPSLLL